MLSAIFEAVFQIVLELLFQIVGEIIGEIFGSVLQGWGKKIEGNMVVAAIGYLVLGAVLGGLSYPVFPDHLIRNHILRIVFGILSPIFLGLILCVINWVVRGRSQGREVFRIDKFISGVVFGIAYAGARFLALDWA